MSGAAGVEFSRPLPLERIGAEGLDHEVLARPDECAALAVRMGIPAIRALVCRFRLRRGARQSVQAEGALRARVVRICVRTLDAFETEVVEDFRLRFVPTEDLAEPDSIDPEADDEIGFEGAALDLGEVAAEQLALALDPYPHRPGAIPVEDPGEVAQSPFAALARLRRLD